MQRYQLKILRTIANAPWYVTNQTLHTDLQIPYVNTAIHDRNNKHRIALASHPNPLVEPMLHPEHNRRLNEDGPSTWQTEEASLDAHLDHGRNRQRISLLDC